MNVSVKMVEADRKWLQDQARKFGGAVNVVFVGVVKRLKNRLKKAVLSGGGLYGVPLFARRSPVTEKLHGPNWGGNIHSNSLIRYWRKNGAQVIGFPDNNPAAAAFGQSIQTEVVRDYTKGERLMLYHRGFNRRNTLDFFYNRPARPIIGVFAEANYPFLYSESRKRVEKLLQNEAKLQAVNARIRSKTLKQLRKK